MKYFCTVRIFLFTCCLALSLSVFGQENLKDKFHKHDIIELNTSNILSIVNGKSFPYYVNIGDHKLELVPSNIISPSYKSFTSAGEFINPNRAIPLKGFTANGKQVRLTIAEGFVSGFIENENSRIYIEPANYYRELVVST